MCHVSFGVNRNKKSFNFVINQGNNIFKVRDSKGNENSINLSNGEVEDLFEFYKVHKDFSVNRTCDEKHQDKEPCTVKAV